MFLGGCPCCGPWRCYGKELNCYNLLPYWGEVTSGIWSEAFRLSGDGIDTDAQLPSSESYYSLSWNQPSQEIEASYVAASNLISLRIERYRQSAFYFRVYPCVSSPVGQAYEFNLSTLIPAGDIAVNLKHIALDGAETVWVSSGEVFYVPVDEDSAFYTGSYVAEFWEGSVLNTAYTIELRNAYQLLNNLSQPVDYKCFDNPPTESGWQPIGGTHPDEAACEAECPPPPGGRTMPQTKTGPGTELANLLQWFNIHAKEGGCGCKSMQKKMDRGGPQWCRDHKEEILSHLEKEAKKRKLPFIKLAASKLIDLAIRRSERG